MKPLILKNRMTALLLAGACCGLFACDDKGNTPPPAPADVTAAIGTYTGTSVSGFRQQV